MKIFTPLVMCLLFVGCTHQSPQKPKPEGVDIPSKRLSISYSALPKLLSNSYPSGSIHSKEGGTQIIYHDFKTNIITTYDPIKERILDTIYITSPYVQEVLRNKSNADIYVKWQSLDTLYFVDEITHGQPKQHFVGYCLEADSIFFNLPVGNQADPRLGPYHTAIQSNMPARFLTDEKFIIPLADFGKMEIDHQRAMAVGIYNTKDSSLKVWPNVNFPYLAEDINYSWIRTFTLCYNQDHKQLLLGNSLTPNVQVYTLDKDQNVVNTEVIILKSKFFEPFPEPSLLSNGETDFDALENLEITGFLFDRLDYIAGLNLYYRFYEIPQPVEQETGVFSTYRSKRNGVMFFDTDFNIVAEHHFKDHRSATVYNCSHMPDGIILTVKNEDQTKSLIRLVLHDD